VNSVEVMMVLLPAERNRAPPARVRYLLLPVAVTLP
jgi:hypothetical protein